MRKRTGTDSSEKSSPLRAISGPHSKHTSRATSSRFTACHSACATSCSTLAMDKICFTSRLDRSTVASILGRVSATASSPDRMPCSWARKTANGVRSWCEASAKNTRWRSIASRCSRSAPCTACSKPCHSGGTSACWGGVPSRTAACSANTGRDIRRQHSAASSRPRPQRIAHSVTLGQARSDNHPCNRTSLSTTRTSTAPSSRTRTLQRWPVRGAALPWPLRAGRCAVDTGWALMVTSAQ